MDFLGNIVNYCILEASACFLFWQQNKLLLFNCFVVVCFVCLGFFPLVVAKIVFSDLYREL